MEDLDRLFRGAERIKPAAGLWGRIAQGSGLKAGAADTKGREARGGGHGHAWGWRMAASFAVGLGLLAALLVMNRGPRDFSPQPVASAEVRGVLGPNGEAVGKAEQVLPDPEILDWHADLGEVIGWDEDAYVPDPVAEE